MLTPIEQRLSELEQKLEELLAHQRAQNNYVTISDVMKRYSVSRSWVHKLISTNSVHAVNISPGCNKPNWRIDVNDLERYLSQRARVLSEEDYYSDFLGV